LDVQAEGAKRHRFQHVTVLKRSNIYRKKKSRLAQGVDYQTVQEKSTGMGISHFDFVNYSRQGKGEFAPVIIKNDRPYSLLVNIALLIDDGTHHVLSFNTQRNWGSINRDNNIYTIIHQ